MADKLWTPDQKLPEGVRKMAWLLFLEAWKGFQLREDDEVLEDFKFEHMFRHCIEMAKAVTKILGENDEPLS